MNPVTFVKGQIFSYAIPMPVNFHKPDLAEWKLDAMLRQKGNPDSSGLISVIDVFWDDPLTTTNLLFMHADTSQWPTGLAGLDVLFTSPSGQTIPSTVVDFNIVSRLN